MVQTGSPSLWGWGARTPARGGLLGGLLHFSAAEIPAPPGLPRCCGWRRLEGGAPDICPLPGSSSEVLALTLVALLVQLSGRR